MRSVILCIGICCFMLTVSACRRSAGQASAETLRAQFISNGKTLTFNHAYSVYNRFGGKLFFTVEPISDADQRALESGNLLSLQDETEPYLTLDFDMYKAPGKGLEVSGWSLELYNARDITGFLSMSGSNETEFQIISEALARDAPFEGTFKIKKENLDVDIAFNVMLHVSGDLE